jgi:heme-degrading monooxygenase HmoA
VEPVILEHAILPVTPGREADFEAALAVAAPIIAGMPGFVDLRVSRSIETPNEYLLLVHWQSVEAHAVGFRGSPEYARWRELLHGFYDPFPVVEHFTPVPLRLDGVAPPGPSPGDTASPAQPQ